MRRPVGYLPWHEGPSSGSTKGWDARRKYKIPDHRLNRVSGHLRPLGPLHGVEQQRTEEITDRHHPDHAAVVVDHRKVADHAVEHLVRGVAQGISHPCGDDTPRHSLLRRHRVQIRSMANLGDQIALGYNTEGVMLVGDHQRADGLDPHRACNVPQRLVAFDEYRLLACEALDLVLEIMGHHTRLVLEFGSLSARRTPLVPRNFKMRVTPMSCPGTGPKVPWSGREVAGLSDRRATWASAGVEPICETAPSTDYPSGAHICHMGRDRQEPR